jgi:hypothetical protein
MAESAAMETALYFPYMRVPQDPWFTQILLYWDNAAIIAPFSLWTHCGNGSLGGYISELVDARLLQLVDANDLPGGSQRKLRDSFLARLSNYSHTGEVSQWMTLHGGKLADDILKELYRRGLARPLHGTGYEAWWNVEYTIANLYMFYLAGAICGSHDGFHPVTDSEDAISLLGSENDNKITRLRKLRYAAVFNALPVPSQPIPAVEIARFKDEHNEELHRIRTFLDGKLADAAAIDDEDLRRSKANEIMQEIAHDVVVLRDQMKRRNWPRIVFMGLGGVASAGLAVAATSVAGGDVLALGLGIASGVTSLAGAGYQTEEIIRASRFDQHAPLVYAALTPDLYLLAHWAIAELKERMDEEREGRGT